MVQTSEARPVRIVRRGVQLSIHTIHCHHLHSGATSGSSRYTAARRRISQTHASRPPPEASRRLRSSGAITCVIPWSRTRLGDRSFNVAGPRLWNKLPASLRSSDSLAQFRRQLKTYLFVKYYTRLRRLVTLAFTRRL